MQSLWKLRQVNNALDHTVQFEKEKQYDNLENDDFLHYFIYEYIVVYSCEYLPNIHESN